MGGITGWGRAEEGGEDTWFESDEVPEMGDKRAVDGAGGMVSSGGDHATGTMLECRDGGDEAGTAGAAACGAEHVYRRTQPAPQLKFGGIVRGAGDVLAAARQARGAGAAGAAALTAMLTAPSGSGASNLGLFSCMAADGTFPSGSSSCFRLRQHACLRLRQRTTSTMSASSKAAAPPRRSSLAHLVVVSEPSEQSPHSVGSGSEPSSPLPTSPLTSSPLPDPLDSRASIEFRSWVASL